MLHFCLSRIYDISKKDVTFPCRQYLLRRRFNLRSMATNSSANDHSVAFVTCPNENVAKKIARCVVFVLRCCIWCNVFHVGHWPNFLFINYIVRF